MKLKYIYTALAIATLGLSSCGDYLDKRPSRSSNAPVETASNLLAVYDYVTNRYCANYFAMYCTDDEMITKEMYESSPSSFNINYVLANYAHFRDGIIANPSDLFWEAEYNRIYKANLIINSASGVEGTEEERNEALSCGYFMRAYSFFELVTYYCMPWSEANKQELGIPLRKGTDYEENISRGTLEQAYQQIFSDLKNAEECAVYDAVPSIPWRASKCAINALYARIYLARGEFETALEYANKALTYAPKLHDFNTLTWGTPGTIPTSTFWKSTGATELKYCETNNWSMNKILYNYSEWIYPDFAHCRTQLSTPSVELTNLFDHDNDLRFTYFFVEHGMARMNTIEYDWYRYDQWSDGRYLNSGLTTSEMLLIKAECQARLGQWQEALSTLTPLREKRFVTGTATALTANNQTEALKQVLEERRRELPFYFRFGDIKRFSVTSDTNDDVTVVRDFYEMTTTGVDTSKPKTYTIPGSSRCWAMPICQTEINSSQGAIEQNPE